MNIIPRSSSLSIKNFLSIADFSCEGLMIEYQRRYGDVEMYSNHTWNSEAVSLVENIIDTEGEQGFHSALEVCEAMVEGIDIEKKSSFSNLFSCFPTHIFLGSPTFSPKHGG